MLTIAIGAFVCGRLLDAGIPPRTVVTATGILMILPAVLWAYAVRIWRPRTQAAVIAEETEA